MKEKIGEVYEVYKMKISGFAQLRNEQEKDNLDNFFRCMDAVCDNIFIYDQNSTDGSKLEYKKHSNVIVIESPTNDFVNEIACKDKLLKLLLAESPDTDWIFWMDGDTILEKKGLKDGFVKNLCETYQNDNSVDALVLGHYNLWRSDIYYRTDLDYHWLHNNGVFALWKNTGNLSYDDRCGLHQPQFPVNPEKSKRVDLNLIHRGFTRDKHIVERYLNYKDKGMTGYPLQRMIDERTLCVEMLPNILPKWFKITDKVNPIKKKKIVDLFPDKVSL
jgi:hypothetical protein